MNRDLSSAMRQYWERRRAGICVRCGRRPAREARITCEPCGPRPKTTGRRPPHYRCSGCGKIGHNRRRCPESELPAAGSADVHTGKDGAA